MTKKEQYKTQWEAFQRGDDRAFEQLYHLCYSDLLRFGHSLGANRELVRDAIQDVFYLLWTRHRTAKINDFNNFLLTSLRNKIVDLQRKDNSRKKLHSLPEDPPQESAEETLFAAEQIAENQELLQRCLAQLPQRQSEAIYWRYFVGLDYPEIATNMDVTQQVAYNYVHRGLQKLRRDARLNMQ